MAQDTTANRQEARAGCSARCCGVVLIRPKSRNEETRLRLADEGIASLCLPLSKPVLSTTFLPEAVIGDEQEADLVFTSPTALEMFEKCLNANRLEGVPGKKTAWCVGKRTADAAQRLGFDRVEIAGGTAGALAQLLREKREALSPGVFHLAPQMRAVALEETLRADGILMETVELYTNQLIDCGCDALIAAFKHFENPFVFFYSRRSAEHFFDLAVRHGLQKHLENVHFISISANVAAAARSLRCRGNWSAKQPQERFMIEMAGQHMQSCRKA